MRFLLYISVILLICSGAVASSMTPDQTAVFDTPATDTVDTIKPVEPGDTIEPGDSVKPVEPIEPIEPGDSIKPVEPVDTVVYGPDSVPLHPEWPHTLASRTIPLVHIVTEGRRPILDKINYLDAGLRIEVPDSQSRWEPLGAEGDLVPLEIRGRGNWSWFTSQKKAYKLKFKKKTTVLGMPAHKHFALICYDPFYKTMWLAPWIGMEVGRLVGFPWVPRMTPVEVVLNGEYRGIYLLVESIKIDPNRLDITVQEEESEDLATVSSGWLVELDNQNDEFQISFPANNASGTIRVTYKEPELISEVQLDWLLKEFTYLNALIENPYLFPHDRWTSHFDLDALAKYVVVRELLHDIDGYSGSQYFYRDLNTDKWVAGPLWDMEFWSDKKPGWIANYGRWSHLNWIPHMMKSPLFNETFIQQWDAFYNGRFREIFDFIDSIPPIYDAADRANAMRWPDEGAPIEEKLDMARSNFEYNSEWIEANKLWQIIVGVDAPEADMTELSQLRAISDGRTLHVSTPEDATQITIHSPQGTMLLSRRVQAGECEIDLAGIDMAHRILLVTLTTPRGGSQSGRIVRRN